MNSTNRLAAFLLIFAAAHLSSAQVPKPVEHRATSQIIDYWVTQEEQRFIGIAEAMPADKYNFAPTNGEFTGVRTFAEQLKHASATNFILGAAILGQAPPPDAGDETGPASLRTKADVIRYLKASFAYLHQAAAAVDDSNTVIASAPISPLPKGTATRLGYAVETLMHGLDHYGQLVEYLRLNNIIPPESRLSLTRSRGIKTH